MKNRELHLHLDGSLRVDTVLELMREEKIDMDLSREALKEKMKVPENCKSLNEYLDKFQLPLQVLQNPGAIERVSYELVKDLSALGMDYSEIRFAPQLSTLKGYSQEDILKGAIKGINKAEKELGDFKAGLIICMMRGSNNENLNRESIYLAKKYLGDTVCALDIAGAEAIYKTRNFMNLFEEARMLNLPLTIHAGEAGDRDDLDVVLAVKTSRIGHGILSIKYDDIIEKLIDNNITLEVCISSNYQTKAIEKIENHPVRQLFDRGVRIAISSDNMTVSNTDINKEFEILKNVLNFSESELNKIRQYTKEASFL
jgi:adenosine deaminase